MNVKAMLFKAYSLGVYDIALWKVLHRSRLINFMHVTIAVSKCFFGFRRRHSMTQLLLDTGLPSFSTVLHNSRYML